jgi:hypothetical protein
MEAPLVAVKEATAKQEKTDGIETDVVCIRR